MASGQESARELQDGSDDDGAAECQGPGADARPWVYWTDPMSMELAAASTPAA